MANMTQEEIDKMSKVDFSKYKINELKKFAKDAGIKNADNMDKATLVKSLSETDYKPESEEDKTKAETTADKSTESKTIKQSKPVRSSGLKTLQDIT